MGYNNLGNVGAKLIAEAIYTGGGGNNNGEQKLEREKLEGDAQQQHQQQHRHHHHPSLSVLDLGFNNIGNEGAKALAAGVAVSASLTKLDVRL